MLEQHTSSEGITTLICQMSNEHLTNAIRYYCRKIKQVRQASEVTNTGNDYSNALYGFHQIDQETAAEINRMAIQKLYPYLAEALLRGLTEVRQDLIIALERDGPLNSPNLLLSGDKEINF